MKDIFDVQLSKNAIKELKKVPKYIVFNLYAWIDEIAHNGLTSS